MFFILRSQAAVNGNILKFRLYIHRCAQQEVLQSLCSEAEALGCRVCAQDALKPNTRLLSRVFIQIHMLTTSV